MDLWSHLDICLSTIGPQTLCPILCFKGWSGSHVAMLQNYSLPGRSKNTFSAQQMIKKSYLLFPNILHNEIVWARRHVPQRFPSSHLSARWSSSRVNVSIQTQQVCKSNAHYTSAGQCVSNLPARLGWLPWELR